MITRKGYKKYQTIIQEKEISKILEKGELQESYNTRVDEVENTIKQVEKIKKKKSKKRHSENSTKEKKAKNGT